LGLPARRTSRVRKRRLPKCIAIQKIARVWVCLKGGIKVRNGKSGYDSMSLAFRSKIGKRPHFLFDPLELRRKYHGSHAFVLLLSAIDKMQVVDAPEH
jgi:hypothetical protein